MISTVPTASSAMAVGSMGLMILLRNPFGIPGKDTLLKLDLLP